MLVMVGRELEIHGQGAWRGVRERMVALAAELGSDVPFALLGGTAVGSGRGEEVVPALARGTYHWVLGFAHHGLSTPAVYRRFDELHPVAAPPEIPASM